MSPKRRCIQALISALFLLPDVLQAAELPPPTGQGAGTCSSYLDLVDGNWQNPLNALNFHGYVSWASGYVSARADTPAALRDQETLKLALVDYCREHPEQLFAQATESLITAPTTAP